jgi:hypothetical protein
MRPVASCAKAPAMFPPPHAALFCAGALLAAPGLAAGKTVLHAPGPRGSLETDRADQRAGFVAAPPG